MKQHHPQTEIAAGNRWYVDEQAPAQLGTRGRRRVIEYRWRVFGEMVDAWQVGSDHGKALTVLDAGCGDGINLVGLGSIAAERGLRIRLRGVDYNPVRLARARQSAARPSLQLGSLCRLPFVDGAFDVVLCNHVIEHVPDLTGALSELSRVLSPAGLLIVGVPNEGCVLARLRNQVIQPSIGRTTDHVQFFTERTLCDALEASGLRARRVERETFFFPCSYVNIGCTELGIGHWLMSALRHLFPSQAGGLIVACEKPRADVQPRIHLGGA